MKWEKHRNVDVGVKISHEKCNVLGIRWFLNANIFCYLFILVADIVHIMSSM